MFVNFAPDATTQLLLNTTPNVELIPCYQGFKLNLEKIKEQDVFFVALLTTFEASNIFWIEAVLKIGSRLKLNH